MPMDDYLVRSGAKNLLTKAVAEILTLRPRVPVLALANHFQAAAFGVTATTVAKSLQISYLSKRGFPDAAFRIFLKFPDSTSQPSTIAAGKAKVPSTRSATGGTVTATCSARSISQSLLNEVVDQLIADFPKGMQALVLQQLQLSSTASDPVDFESFLRAVSACLALEEQLDAATELFALLQQLQHASDKDSQQDKLEAALAQLPQKHQASIRAAFSAAADNGADQDIPKVGDVQDRLVEVALRAPSQ